MSADTLAALEEALRAHVADEHSDTATFVTDWYLTAAVAHPDPDVTTYLHVCSDSAWHVHLGLASIAMRRLNRVEEETG